MSAQANAQQAMPRSAAGASPVAATQYGQVRGVTAENGVHIFKGIPYGAPTSGAGRFRRAGKPMPWSGVRDATAYPPSCPQPAGAVAPLFRSWASNEPMGEDCLGLNIWTPAVNDGGKRPVMVWFHGGDFSSNSGSRSVFDGTRMARNGDIVLVTLNHRLNLFGFLYLGELAPELADSGMVGMLDLVDALTWVRDNIAAFGGDPGNVTIFGQSGGGGKVSTMMAMPEGAGLFHRAIVQSGSYARHAHLEAMTPETGTKHARSLLAALGLDKSDANKLIDMPADALVAGMVKALQSDSKPTFRPIADGRSLPAGPWWPKAPAVSANVPLMIGTTTTEMSMLMGSSRPALFDIGEADLRKRLGYTFASDKVDEIIAFFRNKSPEATPGRLLFDIVTANVFRRGAWTQADLKAGQNAAPVWLYEVGWNTPVDGGKWGSPHSVEHPFVFDNVARSESMVGNGPDAQPMVGQIQPAWLAFARSGNPNHAGIPEWKPYQPETRTTMLFDLPSKAIDGFRDDERKLLDGQPTAGPMD